MYDSPQLHHIPNESPRLIVYGPVLFTSKSTGCLPLTVAKPSCRLRIVVQLLQCGFIVVRAELVGRQPIRNIPTTRHTPTGRLMQQPRRHTLPQISHTRPRRIKSVNLQVAVGPVERQLITQIRTQHRRGRRHRRATAHGDQTIVLRPVRRIVMRARPRVRIVLAVHRNGTARTPANTLVRPAHGNEMITLRHIRRIEMLTRVMVIQTIHRHRRARRRPDRNRHARQRNQREHRRHTRGPPPSIPLHDTGTPPRNRKGRTRPERRARPNGKERGRNYLADTAYQPTPSARQPTETRRSFSDPSAV